MFAMTLIVSGMVTANHNFAIIIEYVQKFNRELVMTLHIILPQGIIQMEKLNILNQLIDAKTSNVIQINSAGKEFVMEEYAKH